MIAWLRQARMVLLCWAYERLAAHAVSVGDLKAHRYWMKKLEDAAGWGA